MSVDVRALFGPTFEIETGLLEEREKQVDKPSDDDDDGDDDEDDDGPITSGGTNTVRRSRTIHPTGHGLPFAQHVNINVGREPPKPPRASKKQQHQIININVPLTSAAAAAPAPGVPATDAPLGRGAAVRGGRGGRGGRGRGRAGVGAGADDDAARGDVPAGAGDDEEEEEEEQQQTAQTAQKLLLLYKKFKTLPKDNRMDSIKAKKLVNDIEKRRKTRYDEDQKMESDPAHAYHPIFTAKDVDYIVEEFKTYTELPLKYPRIINYLEDWLQKNKQIHFNENNVQMLHDEVTSLFPDTSIDNELIRRIFARYKANTVRLPLDLNEDANRVDGDEGSQPEDVQVLTWLEKKLTSLSMDFSIENINRERDALWLVNEFNHEHPSSKDKLTERMIYEEFKRLNPSADMQIPNQNVERPAKRSAAGQTLAEQLKSLFPKHAPPSNPQAQPIPSKQVTPDKILQKNGLRYKIHTGMGTNEKIEALKQAFRLWALLNATDKIVGFQTLPQRERDKLNATYAQVLKAYTTLLAQLKEKLAEEKAAAEKEAREPE